MGIKDCQGSFSNSRIKPRKATTSAVTGNSVVGIAATQLFSANQNRTYITLRNESLGEDIRMGYAAAQVATINDGFLLKFGESMDIESPTEVWAISTSGNPINVSWDEGTG